MRLALSNRTLLEVPGKGTEEALDETHHSPPHSAPLEEYALLGDTRSAALVHLAGSIDWLCMPRFDSSACFAALLGDARHGCWRISPRDPGARSRRRYRPGTLVLETEHVTPSGAVRVVDCMPPGDPHPQVVRMVEGIRGRVVMSMELIIRFDYGWIVPWVRTVDGVLRAVGGPDALALFTPVQTRGQNLTTVAHFTVSAGERIPFALRWHASHEPSPDWPDVAHEIERAERWWSEWSARCSYRGPWADAVRDSLIALKALTYAPTGGIVAAATAALPERLGGVRNWDYRYCWLRDATFTLYALQLGGHRKEAQAWRDWLLRAVAGSPSQIQTLYGVAGERRIPEVALGWLPGYAGSAPVRIGNAAVDQFQLDVYGEVVDALYYAERCGLQPDVFSHRVLEKLMDFLESSWQLPDEGIWEVRGRRRHFTHSKVMAWVAFDRMVRGARHLGFPGPAERWSASCERIHEEVCRRAYDAERGTFTQSYDDPALDASLLMIPLVGFLPARDPRMKGTVAAIERELVHDGLVARYHSHRGLDGLPSGEGHFLACSFWLADNYALAGRTAEARALFERLLALRNDVGLLAEEYDARSGRLLGNFPQAFSHVGLINTAFNLNPDQRTPARDRGACEGRPPPADENGGRAAPEDR